MAADVRHRPPETGRYGMDELWGKSEARNPESERNAKSEGRRTARLGAGGAEPLERPCVGKPKLPFLRGGLTARHQEIQSRPMNGWSLRPCGSDRGVWALIFRISAFGFGRSALHDHAQFLGLTLPPPPAVRNLLTSAATVHTGSYSWPWPVRASTRSFACPAPALPPTAPQPRHLNSCRPTLAPVQADPGRFRPIPVSSTKKKFPPFSLSLSPLRPSRPPQTLMQKALIDSIRLLCFTHARRPRVPAQLLQRQRRT